MSSTTALPTAFDDSSSKSSANEPPRPTASPTASCRPRPQVLLGLLVVLEVGDDPQGPVRLHRHRQPGQRRHAAGFLHQSFAFGLVVLVGPRHGEISAREVLAPDHRVGRLAQLPGHLGDPVHRGERVRVTGRHPGRRPGKVSRVAGDHQALVLEQGDVLELRGDRRVDLGHQVDAALPDTVVLLGLLVAGGAQVVRQDVEVGAGRHLEHHGRPLASLGEGLPLRGGRAEPEVLLQGRCGVDDARRGTVVAVVGLLDQLLDRLGARGVAQVGIQPAAHSGPVGVADPQRARGDGIECFLQVCSVAGAARPRRRPPAGRRAGRERVRRRPPGAGHDGSALPHPLRSCAGPG